MQRTFSLTVDERMAGMRIETVLRKHMQFSRTLIAKLKKSKDAVTVDRKDAKLVDILHCGQKLMVKLPEEKQNCVEKNNFPLDVLYEDEDVIAVNKPHNMPSHPSRFHTKGTLLNALKYYLGYTGHIITRLDKDTTGVVLVAKNTFSAKILTEQIKEGKIEKEYIAVINGALSPSCGKICAPIKRRADGKIIREVSPFGKEAISLYETLEIFGKYSLVKLIPITGRTHQLRVHMSYMGTPIYADTLYGAPQEERIRLHCRKIGFLHPVTQERFIIEAPVSDDFKISEN